jgi:hypothetical protein
MIMRFNRSASALAASLALAAGVAACNGDITSINQNPNSPENAPAGPVFTSAVQTSVGRWLGSGYDLRQTSFVTQYLAEVQYPDEDIYKRLRSTDTQGSFTGPYSSSLEDFKQVQIKGEAASSPAVSAPAAIMSQWEFGYLTDTWGNVPYSNALQGDEGINSPTYDAQQDVYNGIFAALTKAASDLETPGDASLGGADPIYDGDPEAWQKFANSLRARAAMRISYVDQAKANAELTAAFNAPGGVFESNSDNAMLVWPGDGISNNPWSNNFQTRDDHRLSKTFADILVGANDPRVAIFAQPTEDWQNGKAGAAKYAGQPNGLDASTAGTYFTSTSRPGEVFYSGGTTYGFFGGKGGSQPSYLMTYAEVSFIKAEAAARSLGGLTPAEAAGFYTDGIRASMEQWGVSSAAITAYLAQPSVVYVGGTAGLKQIALQKWIALFTDAGQGWAEWRRTCVPSTVVQGPDAIFDYVPRRFEYATTEKQVNGASVEAAIAAQGADAMDTHVWWDTQTAPTCAP